MKTFMLASDPWLTFVGFPAFAPWLLDQFAMWIGFSIPTCMIIRGLWLPLISIKHFLHHTQISSTQISSTQVSSTQVSSTQVSSGLQIIELVAFEGPLVSLQDNTNVKNGNTIIEWLMIGYYWSGISTFLSISFHWEPWFDFKTIGDINLLFLSIFSPSAIGDIKILWYSFSISSPCQLHV